MNRDLWLPPEVLQPVRIRDLKESALCLSYDKRGTHLFVERTGDTTTAVALNGEYEFHAFNIDQTANWKGMVVAGSRIEVDPTSAFDIDTAWAPLGAVLIGNTGVRLQAQMSGRHGFTDKIEIALTATTTVASSLNIGFRRWSFVVGSGSQTKPVLKFEITSEATAD